MSIRHDTNIAHAPDRQLRHNTLFYYLIVAVSSLTGAFGDMSVIVPNLATLLDAPSWVVVFPTVASLSICYFPVVFMGWIMQPHMSRKKLYAATCVLMFASLLVLVVPLLAGVSREVMVQALILSCLVFAVMQGLTILPWWDLFTRLFPGSSRGVVLGRSNGLGALLGLVVAGAAAWMVSSKCPLPFPQNYAAGLATYFLGGLVITVLILFFHEETDPVITRRLSFRAYLGELAGIVRADRPFRLILLGSMLGFTVVAIMPLMLLYAKAERGFSGDHVSLLVALRPACIIPAALIFGQLSARAGAGRVTALVAGVAALGTGVAPLFHGAWQVIPLVLVACAAFIYTFTLVAVMNHAQAGRTHLYLSIYYLAIMIPGLLPLALSELIGRAPLLTLGIVTVLLLSCATVFLLADRPSRAPRVPGHEAKDEASVA